METLEKLEFLISINAPANKVWQTLWEDASYRSWTSVFAAGSYAESDWNEGSKIHFLDPKGSGMYSLIKKKIPNECMVFLHQGIVKDFKELPLDSSQGNWGDNATESYFLSEKNGTTELRVELMISANEKKYFLDKFPLAIKSVKELSEA